MLYGDVHIWIRNEYIINFLKPEYTRTYSAQIENHEIRKWYYSGMN